MTTLTAGKLGGILVCLIGLSSCQTVLPRDDVYRSPEEIASIKQLQAATKGVDLDALGHELTNHLPGQRKFFIVIGFNTGCPTCVELPFEANKTGAAAILAGDEPIGDRPLGSNVTSMSSSQLKSVPSEVFLAGPMGLYVDLDARKLAVAHGPFGTWEECRTRVMRNIDYQP